MLVPSILASVTNSRRFDILDPSLNAIEQLPFAAHCALLWVSTMSPATCPPCPRYVQHPQPVDHPGGMRSPRRRCGSDDPRSSRGAEDAEGEHVGVATPLACVLVSMGLSPPTATPNHRSATPARAKTRECCL